MSETAAAQASKLDQQLDGAYRRALKVTVALSAIALVVAELAMSWRSSLGVLMGAAIGILNLVWLHQGAEMLVRRMMTGDASNAESGLSAGKTGPPAAEGSPSGAGGGPSAAEGGPSKLRVMLFFPLRYFAVIAAVYAILKGYPGVLVSFLVGLLLPILALMGEGIYEAVAFRPDRPRLP